ncbi:MAG: response regulator [Candidatus Doudnabacteria bacterium]|nr:response regulator [Candidatus Doudnabacteria bacterium]
MYDDISKRLLIVEDDGALRGILKSALAMKYNVAEAIDGVQALERINFFRPDAVLLDLLLPKLDGFEVLKSLRESPDPQIANIPVVILSNLSDAKDILKAKNLKADAYFIKSNVDLEEVKKKIAEFLHMDHELNDVVMDFTK